MSESEAIRRSAVMIEICNMSKIYRIGKVAVKALDNISLCIKQHEFVSIVGPSGSGKSTLMNMIGCLDVPTSGEYRLDGMEVSGLTDDQLKSLPDNFLDAELRERVASHGVGFDFKVQLAEPGDKVDDPTVPLPESRKVVTAGRLVIAKVEPGAGGACDKITFNPLVLPKGVGASSDPVLLARPASYAVSLGRRLPDQK